MGYNNKSVSVEKTKQAPDANKEFTFAGIQNSMKKAIRFIRNERQDVHKTVYSEENKRRYNNKYLVDMENEKLRQLDEGIVKKMMQNLHNDLDKLISLTNERIAKMITTPPTEEQSRLLSVLQLRNNIDSAEFDVLTDVFFTNYQSMKTLDGVAKKNNVKLHLPAQYDIAEMNSLLEEGKQYLLRQMSVIDSGIDWNNSARMENHAFFAEYLEAPNVNHDPVYAKYIEFFDTFPHLSGQKSEKTGLLPAERALINVYFSEADRIREQIKSTNAEIKEKHPQGDALDKMNKKLSDLNTELFTAVRETLEQHPDVLPLMPFTDYAVEAESLSQYMQSIQNQNKE